MWRIDFYLLPSNSYRDIDEYEAFEFGEKIAYLCNKEKIYIPEEFYNISDKNGIAAMDFLYGKTQSDISDYLMEVISKQKTCSDTYFEIKNKEEYGYLPITQKDLSDNSKYLCVTSIKNIEEDKCLKVNDVIKINHVAQLFDERTKLFLANTNPAVDNLRRKMKAQNCDFYTIAMFLKKCNVDVTYDMLIIDECSMVSNSDMRKVLEKASYKLLVLVGDTYQIEAISFGNWFSLAKYFLPKKTWNELMTPFRAKNNELLELWAKVRKMEGDVTEHLVNYGYSSVLNESIFQRSSEDEIILCLNYNGLYGINNINRFLQNNNPSQHSKRSICGHESCGVSLEKTIWIIVYTNRENTFVSSTSRGLGK